MQTQYIFGLAGNYDRSAQVLLTLLPRFMADARFIIYRGTATSIARPERALKCGTAAELTVTFFPPDSVRGDIQSA
jgi:hypothetical protein